MSDAAGDFIELGNGDWVRVAEVWRFKTINRSDTGYPTCGLEIHIRGAEKPTTLWFSDDSDGRADRSQMVARLRLG